LGKSGHNAISRKGQEKGRERRRFSVEGRGRKKKGNRRADATFFAVHCACRRKRDRASGKRGKKKGKIVGRRRERAPQRSRGFRRRERGPPIIEREKEGDGEVVESRIGGTKKEGSWWPPGKKRSLDYARSASGKEKGGKSYVTFSPNFFVSHFVRER